MVPIRATTICRIFLALSLYAFLTSFKIQARRATESCSIAKKVIFYENVSPAIKSFRGLLASNHEKYRSQILKKYPFKLLDAKAILARRRDYNGNHMFDAKGSSLQQATKLTPNLAAANESEPRELSFWENMVCGAVSRSVAQVVVHPLNTMKTILQSNRRLSGPTANGILTSAGEAATLRILAYPSNWKLLVHGIGAQFLLSVPHGALNFAMLEYVRRKLNVVVEQRVKNSQLHDSASKGCDLSEVTVSKAGLDFVSSCISTICCSLISAPQSMIMDSIMAGIYPNLSSACSGIMKTSNGLGGFYNGWWAGLVGKIPSYALTETVFEQLKRMHLSAMNRPPTDIEHSIMGCVAAATAVSILMPLDTIKTRVTTSHIGSEPYKGVWDAALRIASDEGYSAFYKGITPRLISVVPMIGIQFGVNEYMKKVVMDGNRKIGKTTKGNEHRHSSSQSWIAAVCTIPTISVLNRKISK